MGIRPENIRLSQPGATSENIIQAFVEKVEPLGREFHLAMKSGADWFLAISPAGGMSSFEKNICAQFDMQQTHFFDTSTGQAII